MGVTEKAYLHDYLAAAIVSFAVAWNVHATYWGEIWPAFQDSEWGTVITYSFLTGIFGYLLAGFIAGYVILKISSSEMGGWEGLRAGIIAFVVYFVITVIIWASRAIPMGEYAGEVMAAYLMMTVFALIFYPIGGYLCDMLAQKKLAVPMFFVARAPPPVPPPAASTCPTCGKPLTYIQQYSRWYCENCKKYV